MILVVYIVLLLIRYMSHSVILIYKLLYLLLHVLHTLSREVAELLYDGAFLLKVGALFIMYSRVSGIACCKELVGTLPMVFHSF